MRSFLRLITAILLSLAAIPAAMADTGELELSVTYRERIALPPDAQLDVQLLDVSRADAASIRIASQRVPLSGVPMRVILPYDTGIIGPAGRYAVVADIWSGDIRLFHTTRRYPVLEDGGNDAVEMVLTTVDGDTAEAPGPLPIAGVEWAVTEIAGEPWGNDDPATMSIDAEGSVAIFGGCNRFVGSLMLSDRDIVFPENLAGTLMACPTEVERLERAFLDALSGVSGFVRYGMGLVLTGVDGRALLHFVQRPE
jgi:putative lipoprotein